MRGRCEGVEIMDWIITMVIMMAFDILDILIYSIEYRIIV